LDLLPLKESYQDVVGNSCWHSQAGFMASKDEIKNGVGDMQSTHKPSVYGEQLWKYFTRSYPKNMALHYPEEKS